jgi:hypothetical protein
MATVINIYGTSRSGSTMLDLILGNAGNAFSCGEISAWFRPYRRHHFKIDCACGKNPCPIWEKMRSASENRIHETLFEYLDVDFVIDSSKDLCWLIDMQKWSVNGNFGVKNLVVWKEPIDLAYSYWKRGHDINYWRRMFIGCYSKFLEAGLPFYSINFNELASDPQKKLAEACSALGMQYFEKKECFWEKEHHYLFGSGGVRKQVKEKRSFFQVERSFPPEFEKDSNLLQDQIAKDSTIQNLIEVIRMADISKVDNDWNTEQKLFNKSLYPAWYYQKKLVRTLRRFFPEKYDVSAE